MGTPSNSHASSPAHHCRNPNWSPTFPNIASGRKALTFTWLIFPKTMSDNQRVSGWSVLCFRTPTITTLSGGVGLVLPLESNMKAARKPQEPSLNGRWPVVMAKYPTRDLQAPNQVRCFAKKHGYLDNILSNPRAIPEVIWLPAKAAWIVQKIVSLSFVLLEYPAEKTHICTYLVKLCQTIKYWNNVISVFGGFGCLDQSCHNFTWYS